MYSSSDQRSQEEGDESSVFGSELSESLSSKHGHSRFYDRNSKSSFSRRGGLIPKGPQRKDYQNARNSLPRGDERRPKYSEHRRGAHARSSAPGESNPRESETRRSSCRTLRNVVPPMPNRIFEELDPDDINEHFEEALNLNTYIKPTLDEERRTSSIRTQGLEGKFFDVQPRELFPSKDGYMIEVRHVAPDGTFSCLLDDHDSKALYVELKKELVRAYGKNTASGKKIDIRNLTVGEIVVAAVRDIHVKSDFNMYLFIRARVKSIDKDDNSAVVSNLDDYEDHYINVGDLYKIMPYFVDQEAFMLKCKIGILEFFSGTEVVHRVLEECPLSTPMCYVMYFSGQYTIDGNTPLVEITKLDDSKFNNIGKYVLNNLIAAVSPLNSLMEDKRLCRIIRCNSKGILWLRFASDDWMWDRVNSTLQKLSQKLKTFRKFNQLTAALIGETDVCDKQKVYIIDFKDVTGNREIRRVTIEQSFVEENKVKVVFIDYGGSYVVQASSIFPLKIFDNALCFIPHMVVKVHLEVVKSMSASILEIQSAVCDPFVIAKVVDEWPGGIFPPEVRILIPERNESANYEEDYDEDDYSDEEIVFSAKTLSGFLIRNELAVPFTEQDKRQIESQKLRASRDVAKTLALSRFDNISW